MAISNFGYIYFKNEVEMFGDREVQYLDRLTGTVDGTPGQTIYADELDAIIFKDVKTGSLAVIPRERLNSYASANVWYPGWIDISYANYEPVREAFNNSTKGILIVNDSKKPSIVREGNWNATIANNNELLEAIAAEYGIKIVGKNTMGSSYGDSVSMRDFANSNKPGICCIMGASCEEPYDPLNLSVNGNSVQGGNPVRAFMTEREYQNCIGKDFFIFESNLGEKYTYIATLNEKGANTFLFEVSGGGGTGSAHNDAYKKAFNAGLLDALCGDEEAMRRLYETYPPKKYIDGEWQTVSYEEYAEAIEYNIRIQRAIADIEEVAINDKVAVFKTKDNENITIKLVYDSVVTNVKPLEFMLNNTKVNDNKKQDCYSTSVFPDSLNDAKEYLFSASSNLRNKLGNDIENIAQILSNYAYLDSDLAAYINYLDGDNMWYFAPEEYEFNIASEFDSTGTIMELFSQIIPATEVGKIDMKDISSMLYNGTLIGPLGNSLSNEIEEANEMAQYIDSLIYNTEYIDPVWTAMSTRLGAYKVAFDAEADAAKELNLAFVKALQNIQDYYDETLEMLAGSKIDLQGVLDDGQIPIYEHKNIALANEIAELQALKAELEAVEEFITVYCGTDENGNAIYDTVKNPEWAIAQTRITIINTVEIPKREEEIAYNTTYIERLNGLADIINESNLIIQNAIETINTDYVAKVNARVLDLISVKPID